MHTMTRLNQIIAVEKGIKNVVNREVTDAYHLLQKNALLTGISRVYTPKDDEGDALPAEYTKVQANALDIIKQAQNSLTKLFDVTATKDWANLKATADIVIDGKALITGVPVTYLLFLEKQLTDMHTVFKKLPVLDGSETWAYNESQACYASTPTQTIKTKKIMKAFEKAPATDKHPAQVDTFTEDVLVGTWNTTKLSGALPATVVSELVAKVEKLQAAVKFARETANSIEVTEQKVGEPIYKYLFG